LDGLVTEDRRRPTRTDSWSAGEDRRKDTPSVRIWITDAELRRAVDSMSHPSVRTVSTAEGADAAVLTPQQCDADLLASFASGALLQLTTSGLDGLPPSAAQRSDLVWASANDAFADPVAEHALMLILASLRDVKLDARAVTWGAQHGDTLFGRRVTIVGAGSIAESLARLLAPFRVQLTIVRGSGGEVPYADRTALDIVEGVIDADVVVLALPLTRSTHGLVDQHLLSHFAPHAVLVNVSRGAIIETHALLAALDAGRLRCAAMDVVDPEPLPDGHPLWDHPRAVITPHTANPPSVRRHRLSELVVDNSLRWARGQALRNRFHPDGDS
jgi:phosphoglycerate dehydrogenase-like enzyme